MSTSSGSFLELCRRRQPRYKNARANLGNSAYGAQANDAQPSDKAFNIRHTLDSFFSADQVSPSDIEKRLTSSLPGQHNEVILFSSGSKLHFQ